MLEITFEKHARQEFLDAQNYYDEQQFGLGQEFVLSIREDCRKIAESPNIWSIIHGNVHRFQASRFPYAIYYIVRTDDIFVLAVAHHSRKPLYWIERL